MPQTSLEQRVRIHTLLAEGYSVRDVTKREGVAHSTVVNIRKKYRETKNFKNKPKSSWPRIFGVRDERKILQYISSGQCSTAVDVQKKLLVEENFEVSRDTIAWTFKRNGLCSRIK